jgi:hypothetical protein
MQCPTYYYENEAVVLHKQFSLALKSTVCLIPLNIKTGHPVRGSSKEMIIDQRVLIEMDDNCIVLNYYYLKSIKGLIVLMISRNEIMYKDALVSS